MKQILFVLVVGWMGVQTVRAECPMSIHYQARLVEESGPVNGARNVRFDLYNDPAAGVLLYTETDAVTCNDGLFSTVMGDGNPAAFVQALTQEAEIWLQVLVNLNPIGARQRLQAVPYAVQAGQAEALAAQGQVGGRVQPLYFLGTPLPAVVLGSTNNEMGALSYGSVIGGGAYNRIAGNTIYASIAGGMNGSIGTNSSYASILGGAYNNIGTNAVASVVLGGYNCDIAPNAQYACAAGRRGKANHPGAFVFADSQNADFSSTASNSFHARFAEGYYLRGGEIHGNGAGLSNTEARVLSDQGMIGARVLAMSYLGEEVPSVILGASNCTIGAGSFASIIAGGEDNHIGANTYEGVILGGDSNSIGASCPGCVLLGGWFSSIGDHGDASICIGINNSMGTGVHYSAISSGRWNGFGDGGQGSVIAGGVSQHIGSNVFYSAILGGTSCRIGNHASYSMVGGKGARANHAGSFVWADYQSGYFTTTASNQFLVRAAGGVGLGTENPLTQLTVEREVNAAGTPENHVALIRNSSTGSNGDLLALRSGYMANPGSSINFVSFFNGDDTLVGEIQGNGSGGVSYSTAGADYAEYVRLADGVPPPAAGTIVGIDHGRVVTETEGVDRVMVVSDRAAVVGNSPGEKTEGHALVCFIGQVPVWVRGPVQAGDYIVAGADGVGIAVSPAAIRETDLGRIVGQAWESYEGGKARRINTAIGLDQTAACRQVLQNELKDVRALVVELSARVHELEAR